MQGAFASVPGVEHIEVDYAARRAAVFVHVDQINVEALLAAVATEGYPSELLPE